MKYNGITMLKIGKSRTPVKNHVPSRALANFKESCRLPTGTQTNRMK